MKSTCYGSITSFLGTIMFFVSVYSFLHSAVSVNGDGDDDALYGEERTSSVVDPSSNDPPFFGSKYSSTVQERQSLDGFEMKYDMPATFGESSISNGGFENFTGALDISNANYTTMSENGPLPNLSPWFGCGHVTYLNSSVFGRGFGNGVLQLGHLLPGQTPADAYSVRSYDCPFGNYTGYIYTTVQTTPWAGYKMQFWMSGIQECNYTAWAEFQVTDALSINTSWGGEIVNGYATFAVVPTSDRITIMLGGRWNIYSTCEVPLVDEISLEQAYHENLSSTFIALFDPAFTSDLSLANDDIIGMFDNCLSGDSCLGFSHQWNEYSSSWIYGLSDIAPNSSAIDSYQQSLLVIRSPLPDGYNYADDFSEVIYGADAANYNDLFYITIPQPNNFTLCLDMCSKISNCTIVIIRTDTCYFKTGTIDFNNGKSILKQCDYCQLRMRKCKEDHGEHFLQLSETSFIDETIRLISSADVEDCKYACRLDCSCKGVVYDISNNNCMLKSSLTFNSSKSWHTTYIRQNISTEQESDKSQNLLVNSKFDSFGLKSYSLVNMPIMEENAKLLMPGWNVSGSVYLTTNQNASKWLEAYASLCHDQQNQSLSKGKVSQKFPTTANSLYNLSLNIGTSKDVKNQVVFQIKVANSTFNMSTNNPDGWDHEMLSFVATDNVTSISISYFDGDYINDTLCGIVDNIEVDLCKDDGYFPNLPIPPNLDSNNKKDKSPIIGVIVGVIIATIIML